MDNQEWQRRMSAAMSEITSLIHNAPKGECWEINEELDVMEVPSSFGCMKHAATGWRTITIRYFVTPGLKDLPEVMALACKPEGRG